jgi:hypothetical protein
MPVQSHSREYIASFMVNTVKLTKSKVTGNTNTY